MSLALIDSILANRLQDIQDAQTLFRNARARFLQLPWTHTITPDSSTAIAPDNVTVRIAGEEYSWEEIQAFASRLLPNTLRSRIQIHNYNGPLGHGFVVILETINSGRTMQRHINAGPEAHKARGWHIVEEVE